MVSCSMESLGYNDSDHGSGEMVRQYANFPYFFRNNSLIFQGVKEIMREHPGLDKFEGYTRRCFLPKSI